MFGIHPSLWVSRYFQVLQKSKKHAFVGFLLTLHLASLHWFLSFNQFVRCASCGGEFYIARSKMNLGIPHGFHKTPASKVFEAISKSQHKRFQNK